MHRSRRLRRRESPDWTESSGNASFFWQGLRSGWLLSFLGARQLQPERASFARFRFDSHAASHTLGGLLYDGQTNARAFVFVVEALKDLENPFLRLLFDADPIVFEKQADAAIMRL